MLLHFDELTALVGMEIKLIYSYVTNVSLAKLFRGLKYRQNVFYIENSRRTLRRNQAVESATIFCWSRETCNNF